MKKRSQTAALLALILALMTARAACAEPGDAMKAIFDALVAEDSAYSDMKGLYQQFYENATFEETLSDDAITITAGGSAYMEGSWTFTRDGDYLTAAFAKDDDTGLSITTQVLDAVAVAFGMNPTLTQSYVNGLSALKLESDNFSIAEDAATGASNIRVNIAGPWDMKELDDMVFDENTLHCGALDADGTSMGSSIGKVMMVANGDVNDLTVLLGEYGGLDELAYRSIINIAGVMRPKGWQDFTAAYTELADAQDEGWSVKLNADWSTVGMFIEDVNRAYSYALIRFGA